MSGYARIQLKADVDINEIAPLLIDISDGQMVAVDLEDQKTTDGQVDPEGTHDSSSNWVGRTCTQGTDSDSGPRKGNRHQGHRHFFVKGTPDAVEKMVDIFKKKMPGQVWRDVDIPEEVRDCYYIVLLILFNQST